LLSFLIGEHENRLADWRVGWNCWPQGDKDERIYGLGQGNWTGLSHCGTSGFDKTTGQPQVVVPLERNGQTVELLQRKFHVTIPFAYSTAGYGVVFNMPGYGHVTIGAKGEGGMEWKADAALGLDVWITAGSTPAAVYEQYADATGHTPPLREHAMLFWQSRNRYKSSAIALGVAEHYQQL
jgi:alpha-glucosidase (family GH31 glycosyl hydrolase)